MIRISQSLIKDMTKPDGYCGHYLNSVYNLGWKLTPSDAIVDGLYFEYQILGATAFGVVPKIPKSKTNGSKLKRELDMERVVEQARVIIEANHIAFDSRQAHIEREDRHGHIDAVGYCQYKPYLFDLKYTGMSWSGYEREMKWGDLAGNYTLQARHYQSLWTSPRPFLFLVFGDGWARFFEVPVDTEAIRAHCDLATECLETFNSMDYRPTSDARLCFTCPMAGECKVKNNQIKIETL